MNILCRSRILVSSLCRQSSLIEKAGVYKCSRCFSLTVNVASCQQQRGQTASLRCYSESIRYYSDSTWCDSDRDENRHEARGEFKQDSEGMDDISSNINTTDHRPSETFTLDVLVSLLRQENAIDLCVIKVPDHIKYSEYFIVVSGLSPRHIRAMALYAVKVYKFLKKDKDPHAKIEGKDTDDWMCIDFGNMVVHIMLPETRELYELEKLWTLRAYDEQLNKIPPEVLPEDFILDAELTK